VISNPLDTTQLRTPHSHRSCFPSLLTDFTSPSVTCDADDGFVDPRLPCHDHTANHISINSNETMGHRRYFLGTSAPSIRRNDWSGSTGTALFSNSSSPIGRHSLPMGKSTPIEVHQGQDLVKPCSTLVLTLWNSPSALAAL
jgi:hypothetical protein